MHVLSMTPEQIASLGPTERDAVQQLVSSVSSSFPTPYSCWWAGWLGWLVGLLITCFGYLEDSVHGQPGDLGVWLVTSWLSVTFFFLFLRVYLCYSWDLLGCYLYILNKREQKEVL